MELSPDELLQALDKLYAIKISRRTLLNYVNWGLISKPFRSSLGRGQGRNTIYEKKAIKEIYGTYKMLHDAKKSPNEVLRAKKCIESHHLLVDEIPKGNIQEMEDYMFALQLYEFEIEGEKILLEYEFPRHKLAWELLNLK